MKDNNPKPLSQILKESAIRALWLVAIVFVIYLLQGCGNKRLASIEERQTKSSQVKVNTDDDYSAVDQNTDVYQVKAGDTLYSIAFRFGLDYRTLAKANGIGRSYLINVGQNLNIEAARKFQEPKTRETRVATSKPVVTREKPNLTRTNQGTSKPVVVSRNQKPIVSSGSNKPKPKPPTSNTKKPQNNQGIKHSDSNKPVKFWIWPNMGRVDKGFVATGRKGIDIAGNMGDPVRASAAGRVVYAGRGLRGYGNLVIIKHNNSFISAYAHNRSLLVKENEIIKAGQKIAEMGRSDSDIPKLHFEIRYKGKPTDPLKYLPKR